MAAEYRFWDVSITLYRPDDVGLIPWPGDWFDPQSLHDSWHTRLNVTVFAFHILLAALVLWFTREQGAKPKAAEGTPAALRRHVSFPDGDRSRCHTAILESRRVT